MNDAFELQTLLDLRQRERDEVERRFVDAQRLLNERRAAYEEALASADGLEAKIGELRKTPPALAVAEALRHTEYVRALEIELEDRRAAAQSALAAAREASDAADVQRAALAEAEAALEAVEKRREEWEAEREQRRTQKAEDEREDLALRQWMEKSK